MFFFFSSVKERIGKKANKETQTFYAKETVQTIASIKEESIEKLTPEYHMFCDDEMFVPYIVDKAGEGKTNLFPF